MKLQFITGILILILATCSMQQPKDSGLEGQVFIGPMCPVVQVGQPCPEKPYQATLIVTSPNGSEIANVKTDEQGRFKIPLAAGAYILHPTSSNVIPFATDQSFIVESGKFTTLTVNYDSGIR